jgi:hypothetical protein
MNNDEPKPLTEPEKMVGYGNPPKDTRFKKGVSGNPKGRPKGSLNVATILIRSLRKRVVINENGHRRSVWKLEAGIIHQVNKAASGDLRALQQLVEWANEAEQKQNLAATQNPVMNQLDQQVMQSILDRFQAGKDNNPKSEDALDDDDESA